VRAPALRALGLMTAWGHGAAAIPEDALSAADGRHLLSLGRPSHEGERFRRATRECVLGIAAVETMLKDACAPREAIAGERTALLYAAAGSYAASNRLFIERGIGGAYFPYTAPAAVPAEVTIEFCLTGPFAIFIGGPPATLRAIWYAATLLEAGLCDRALVLAVETFEECADLYTVSDRRTGHPLVEAAASLWLEPGVGALSLETHRGGPDSDHSEIRRRLGETFACEPLAVLDLWRHGNVGVPLSLRGRWRGETARLSWTDAMVPRDRAPRSHTAGTS